MATALEARDLWLGYRSLRPFSLRGGKAGGRSQRREALRGVSFRVEEGEILGVVGRNGSGKSTLLRAAAGILSPDRGSIETFGRSVSLLAIGVGFQPRLTGRDNILLSGLLMGFSEAEIRERTPEIIAFSELGEAIDRPVRTYSSGMYSKLAFSITVTLETSILLIDEVLSVGDARFNQKSFAKMEELIAGEGRTVLMVSHAAATIRRLCTRALWLEEGRVRLEGPVEEVLRAYGEEG